MKDKLTKILNKAAIELNPSSPEPNPEPNTNPELMGACCHSPEAVQDGWPVCEQTSKEHCDAWPHGRGVWKANKSCEEADCEQQGNEKGACCIAPTEFVPYEDPDNYPSNCQLKTKNECLAQKGKFHGVFTRCDDPQISNSCDTFTKGACCKWDGTCESTIWAECKDGYWQGPGTDCEYNLGGVNCKERVNTYGACCIKVVGQNRHECHPNSHAQCVARNGAFLGEGSTCEDANCEKALLGSCCIQKYDWRVNRHGSYNYHTYDCAEGITRNLCNDLAEPIREVESEQDFDHTWNGINTVFNGAGTKCKDQNCQEFWDPKRACCKLSPRYIDGEWTFEESVWTCSLETKKDCERMGERTNWTRQGVPSTKTIWHSKVRNCGEIDCGGQGYEQTEDTNGSVKDKLTESLKRLKKKS